MHVRVPGLSEDLESLKRLLAYIDTNQVAIYEAIEPIPVPVRGDYPSEEAYEGALKRYKRRKVSHQYKVPAARVAEAMEATTVRQFFDAHSKLQANGKRAYGLTTRAGINLLQLQETDTVEFRHFTNTLDVGELSCCFMWVANFIEGALDNASVPELLAAYPYEFPSFMLYNHAMEVGYEYTNFQHHSRKIVSARIAELRKLVDIDNCTAEETVEAIKQIEGKFAL